MKRVLALLGMGVVSLALMSSEIDLRDLFNYAGQDHPNYINEDNTNSNQINNAGATLGRVLFYDVKLSSDNSVACASCHKQEFAFGDDAVVSQGVNGTTGRHSMRLVNARFSEESHFFWDERAGTLEEQTTMPIQDHVEMGFSGTNGDQDMADLIDKLEQVDYYKELFFLVYGDVRITENRMQLALAQFVRSIQSFDSKYDIGRSQVNNDGQAFPNFTDDENAGKDLFRRAPIFDNDGSRIDGGAGCNICHRSPEFGIDDGSESNSVISKIGSEEYDYTVTRAPSLRDIFNPNGDLNGPLMHTGEFSSMEEVIDIYNEIIIPEDAQANQIDRRLRPNGQGQKLNLTETEKSQLIAFLKTLTGSDIYTNPMYSNPFDENGNLTLLGTQLDAPDVITKNISVDLNEDGVAIVSAEEINDGTEGIDLNFQLSKTSFSCEDIGENQVSLTVTNAFGNSSSADAIITVEDNLLPIIKLKDLELELNEDGLVSMAAEDLDDACSDNCGIDSISINKSRFNCEEIGWNEIIFTVIDANGNKNSLATQVEIVDKIAPEVLVKNIEIDLKGESSIKISAEDIDNGSSDNCSFELRPAVDEFFSPGEYEIDLIAEDASGNISIKKAIIKVSDSLLGVEDTIASFNLYPNPATDQLNIEIDKLINQIEIYDVYGNLILNSTSNRIDIRSLSSGSYIISILTMDGILLQKKFIKVD